MDSNAFDKKYLNWRIGLLVHEKHLVHQDGDIRYIVVERRRELY